MKITHDTKNLEYRNPFGAVPTGTEVLLTLKIEESGENSPPLEGWRAQPDGVVDHPHSVFLRLWENEEEKLLSMMKEEELYTIKLKCDKPQLIFYYFKIDNLYFGVNQQPQELEPNSFQITVYDKDYKTPKWWGQQVVYQIFVDRFFNGNPHKEVIKNHDEYIIHQNWNEDVSDNIHHRDFFGGNLQGVIEKLDYLENLGITCIYFNPIFEARSNHKYDTANYMKIDPMFGDEKTFKNLCKEAKKRGISVILDGVFSHTGSDSVYFNKHNTYDSVGAYQSKESPFYKWYQFTEFPDEYKCWWGNQSMPEIDELQPSYQGYILKNVDSVVKHWLKCGARGWRLDVADELPDAFIKVLREEVKKEKEDSIVIGEVWEDASNKVSYGVQREYFLGEELDGVINYPFKDAIFGFLKGEKTAYEANKVFERIIENYPPQSLSASFLVLGNHDTARIKTVINNNNLQKLAVLWQMTFMGVPCVYYADEVGQTGDADPYNRRSFPWNNVDLELMEYYKSLIAIRKYNSILQNGHYTNVPIDNDVLAYIRHNFLQAILVVINRANSEKELVIDLSGFGGSKQAKIKLAPFGGIIYDVKNKKGIF